MHQDLTVYPGHAILIVTIIRLNGCPHCYFDGLDGFFFIIRNQHHKQKKGHANYVFSTLCRGMESGENEKPVWKITVSAFSSYDYSPYTIQTVYYSYLGRT